MVSERDRAMMVRVARDLANGESDERGTPEQRRAILDEINADRIDHGIEPLADRAPEEGFYDRAKSLGMARIDR
jgi:adenosine deaminase